MKPHSFLLALVVSLLPGWAQTPSLTGAVTDPSGAAVPNATIQLRGPRGHRTKTSDTGQYSFPSLETGKYQITIQAKGFSAAQKKDIIIDRPIAIDAQLAIQTKTQVVNVEDALGRVGAEPQTNGSSIVMRERQLAALSDDPDELALQLQALAGPAPGPNGGQIFIDGFAGGNLPPKSAIREVRINSNPFSPEYDRPGFARIDVFTKAGADSLRGQVFAQYNDDRLNTRNPLLTEATLPPYRTQFYGFDLGGPLRRNKASFMLAAERRQIDDNAIILATTLDGSLNPKRISQALGTPQTRTTVTPRIDYALNRKNTLVVRYQELRIGLDNQGVGDFNLPSRAYGVKQAEHTLQATETAMISARSINETRFQFMRLTARDSAIAGDPAIDVRGAFAGGGATAGNSGSTTDNWELTNISSHIQGRHTLQWGGRARQSRLADTAFANFAGTFTFYTLDQYRQTLAGEPGAGPSQFSLNAGSPTARLSQTDAGLFVNDDWRARPNLTFSLGLRYEAQTNLGDLSNFGPRLGIAWGLDAQGKRPAKTVLRAGFGTFYDRIPLAVTLAALRYNGTTQQSYLILNPTFFPKAPTPAELEGELQPQQLRPVYAGIEAPRLYQSSVGIERQLNQGSRLTLTWIGSRGVHLLNARNINAPIDGSYPLGDRSIRLLTESAGLSSQNQLTASANVNYRKITLFGFYTLSYGRDNNEGVPADPYNLRAEWGPSVYADVRHRLALGTTIPMPWKFSASAFFVANSGLPYNITTGFDPNNTGYAAQRPGFLPGADASDCQGSGLTYAAGFGCFIPNPGGGPAIEHNWARGPAAVNLSLRVARTWSFGREGQTGNGGSTDSGSSHGGGGGPMPPRAMPAPETRAKYNLTLSASTLNAPNHPNFAPPNGDLSSPYFGQFRSLGGLMVIQHGGSASTYNRKIDVQLRFTF